MKNKRVIEMLFNTEEKLRTSYKKSLEQAYENRFNRPGRVLYPALKTYIESNYKRAEQEKKSKESLPKKSVSDVSLCQMSKPAPNKVENVYGRHLRVPEYASYDQKAKDEENYSDFFEENFSALQERMKHMSDTFQEYLMYLISSRGFTNTEVYKRAIITKQLFSKIKQNPQYHPDKATAMRLCVGAKLNLDEAKDLLARAGYALSPCDKRDIIFSFFLEHEVYDMIEIDIALEEHGLPCFIE